MISSVGNDDNRKVRRTARRRHSPFQFLKDTSDYQFKESDRRRNAESPQETEGWQKFKAAGFVFLAFWVESYLTYCVHNLYEGVEYEAVERLSPRKKAELIAEKLEIDYKDYKFTVNALFNFRDSLAHGKTKIGDEISDESWTLAKYNTSAAKSIMGDYEDLDQKLETDWEAYLRNDPSKIEKELAEILESFYRVGDFPFHPLGVSDLKSFSSELVG